MMMLKTQIVFLLGCLVVASEDCPSLALCVQNLEKKLNDAFHSFSADAALDLCLEVNRGSYKSCITNADVQCGLTGNEPVYVQYRRLEYRIESFCSDNVCSDLTAIRECWEQLDYNAIRQAKYHVFCWSVSECKERPLTGDACRSTNLLFESNHLSDDTRKIIQHICDPGCENLNETIDAIKECNTMHSKDGTCRSHNAFQNCLSGYPVCSEVNDIIEYFREGFGDTLRQCRTISEITTTQTKTTAMTELQSSTVSARRALIETCIGSMTTNEEFSSSKICEAVRCLNSSSLTKSQASAQIQSLGYDSILESIHNNWEFCLEQTLESELTTKHSISTTTMEIQVSYTDRQRSELTKLTTVPESPTMLVSETASKHNESNTEILNVISTTKVQQPFTEFTEEPKLTSKFIRITDDAAITYSRSELTRSSYLSDSTRSTADVRTKSTSRTTQTKSPRTTNLKTFLTSETRITPDTYSTTSILTTHTKESANEMTSDASKTGHGIKSTVTIRGQVTSTSKSSSDERSSQTIKSSSNERLSHISHKVTITPRKGAQDYGNGCNSFWSQGSTLYILLVAVVLVAT